MEFILPTKTINAFNEKTLKWGNKVIKYKDSGWVFVRAILDEELIDEISGMIYFQKWRNAIIHKFDFLSVSRGCYRFKISHLGYKFIML